MSASPRVVAPVRVAPCATWCPASGVLRVWAPAGASFGACGGEADFGAPPCVEICAHGPWCVGDRGTPWPRPRGEGHERVALAALATWLARRCGPSGDTPSAKESPPGQIVAALDAVRPLANGEAPAHAPRPGVLEWTFGGGCVARLELGATLRTDGAAPRTAAALSWAGPGGAAGSLLIASQVVGGEPVAVCSSAHEGVCVWDGAAWTDADADAWRDRALGTHGSPGLVGGEVGANHNNKAPARTNLAGRGSVAVLTLDSLAAWLRGCAGRFTAMEQPRAAEWTEAFADLLVATDRPLRLNHAAEYYELLARQQGPNGGEKRWGQVTPCPCSRYLLHVFDPHDSRARILVSDAAGTLVFVRTSGAGAEVVDEL